jgi:3-phenylpropionate/trans-cinnamate dioxygenase ferredoxin reductase subunit
MNEHVVIVGAGHAGSSCAAALRRNGYTGRITLVGEETHLPYQRPPLSKGWLSGEPEAGAARLTLRPTQWYEKNSVELRLSMRVAALDRAGRRVVLAGGEAVEYDRLVLATGASPRQLRLPGAHLPGVVVLRDRADAAVLRGRLAEGHKLVVVGGGYLGLEAAATARGLGVAVDVVEQADRLLARVASEPVAEAVALRHRAHGVRLHLGAETTRIVGDDHVRGIELSSGEMLLCDTLLVAIGAAPNIRLAAAAGLTCTDGIVVDERGATSDPDVFAIGDVTVRPVTRGRARRVESVGNALEQAGQVAAAICGLPAPEPVVPWFWSDQYGQSVQIAGFADPADDRILHGDPGDDRFAVFHLSDGLLTGVEAVNSPRDAMTGKRWLASGGRPDFDALGIAASAAS